MIELRYVIEEGTQLPTRIPRLQYRQHLEYRNAVGELVSTERFGPWTDVPIVEIPARWRTSDDARAGK